MQTNKTTTMKRTTSTIGLFLAGIFAIVILLSCTKQKDYSYLNTDRRPQVTIISERYTDPPDLNENKTWKPYKIVYHPLSRDIDYRSYENLPPDTLISKCSIDKVDSLFKIEIRKYKIN